MNVRNVLHVIDQGTEWNATWFPERKTRAVDYEIAITYGVASIVINPDKMMVDEQNNFIGTKSAGFMYTAGFSKHELGIESYESLQVTRWKPSAQAYRIKTPLPLETDNNTTSLSASWL